MRVLIPLKNIINIDCNVPVCFWQTKLLLQYVLNLAKYDQNYDIRDRARFLKHLLLPADKSSTFTKHAKKIILATKPAPVIKSIFKGQ